METGEGENPCTAGRVRQEGSPQQEIIQNGTRLARETRRMEKRHMVQRKHVVSPVNEHDLDIGNSGSDGEERKQRRCQSTASSAGRKAGCRVTTTGGQDVLDVFGESSTSAATAESSGRGDGEYQYTSLPYAGGNLCRGSVDNVFGSAIKPRVPHSSRYRTLSYFDDFSSSRCTGSGRWVEECESKGVTRAVRVAPVEGREGLRVRRSTVEGLGDPDEGSEGEEGEQETNEISCCYSGALNGSYEGIEGDSTKEGFTTGGGFAFMDAQSSRVMGGYRTLLGNRSCRSWLDI